MLVKKQKQGHSIYIKHCYLYGLVMGVWGLVNVLSSYGVIVWKLIAFLQLFSHVRMNVLHHYWCVYEVLHKAPPHANKHWWRQLQRCHHQQPHTNCTYYNRGYPLKKSAGLRKVRAAEPLGDRYSTPARSLTRLRPVNKQCSPWSLLHLLQLANWDQSRPGGKAGPLL